MRSLDHRAGHERRRRQNVEPKDWEGDDSSSLQGCCYYPFHHHSPEQRAIDDQQDLKARIERDVQAYNATFVRAVHENAPTLMRQWMHLPVLAFGADATRTLATVEDLDARYEAGIRSLDGTGYERSVLTNFEITLLNANTALVFCDAVRQRADGSPVVSFKAGYVWTAGEEHWQLAAFIARR